MYLTIGKKKFDLSKPIIIGVLNCTPDSFSGDGVLDVHKAVEQAEQMIQDGAHIIDIGGESSRPGSEPVSEQEELHRVLPVVEKLITKGILVSVDTYKASVAQKCLEAGAHMINDITAGSDPNMFSVVSRFHVPYVIMHMQGNPKTMQEQPFYNDVVAEVYAFFEDKLKKARSAGIKDIILDPGIGFGKRVEDNLTLIHKISNFTALDCPILIGASRKSFIGKITGEEVDQRLPGTLAAHVLALSFGAHIFRCHDVKENKQALEIAKNILSY